MCIAHRALPYTLSKTHKPKSVECLLCFDTGRPRFMVMNDSLMRVLLPGVTAKVVIP